MRSRWPLIGAARKETSMIASRPAPTARCTGRPGAATLAPVSLPARRGADAAGCAGARPGSLPRHLRRSAPAGARHCQQTIGARISCSPAAGRKGASRSRSRTHPAMAARVAVPGRPATIHWSGWPAATRWPAGPCRADRGTPSAPGRNTAPAAERHSSGRPGAASATAGAGTEAGTSAPLPRKRRSGWFPPGLPGSGTPNTGQTPPGPTAAGNTAPGRAGSTLPDTRPRPARVALRPGASFPIGGRSR